MEKVYRQLDDGTIIKGLGLPAFIYNFNYIFVLIKIYEDGLIDCSSPMHGLEDYDGFVRKVREGWIVTALPKGVNVYRFQSFFGKIDELKNSVKEEEFIKQVLDVLKELQGKSTSSVLCRESYDQCVDNPSEKNKESLEACYLAVPEHMRQYLLGDMDLKDFPIKRILSIEEISPTKKPFWKRLFS